jgi:hypothetical protein
LLPYGVSGTPVVFTTNPKILAATYDSSTKAIKVTAGTNGNYCVAADTDVTVTLVDEKGFQGSTVITVKDLNGAAGC